MQSKGDGAPHYQRWTRRSADEWPALAAELEAKTGIAVGHQRPGGLHLCLGEAELEARHALMERMREQSANFGFDYRMVDRGELADMLPEFGPAVSGASWTAYDGHANPLNLLHALHKGFVENGRRYLPNSTVTEAVAAPGDFRIRLAGGEIGAPKVVLAAGLGNADLAQHFGLSAPVKPLKGQILVTERAQHVLPMPITTIRQTVESGLMLGDSQEDAGFDTTQKPAVMPFLDRLCRPARSVIVPTDDEVVACRCEEVSVGKIRRATRLGAQGPNQLKAFTRCGMGPCQGRICGPVVAAIAADILGKPIAEIGTWRPRAPFKPTTVGALADLEVPDFGNPSPEPDSRRIREI